MTQPVIIPPIIQATVNLLSDRAGIDEKDWVRRLESPGEIILASDEVLVPRNVKNSHYGKLCMLS